MSAEVLLLAQGLRATSGSGSHMTVEDAVCAQFQSRVVDFRKVTFESFRQGRHAAQYFDPLQADKSLDDACWALDTAQRALNQTRALLAGGGLTSY
jgi:hypothetical protein